MRLAADPADPADPDELERIARGLRADAADLRDIAADHQQRAESMRWVSAAADEARAQVRTQRGQLDQAAEALVDAAARLDAYAQTVRERQEAIADFERRVTEWFSSAAAKGASVVSKVIDEAGEIIERVVRQPPIWSTWPVTPTTLPPPGDQRWLEVGAFMTRQGAL